MKKKHYTSPLIEVIGMNTVVMQAFGPASMPTDPGTSNPAPKRATEPF